MERIRRLSWYQKTMLVALAVMTVVFAFAHHAITSREGFEYREQILIPEEQDGTTVYTGRVDGEEARFTVWPEGKVTYRQGDREFGPYTVTEDPAASPREDGAVLLEIHRGTELLFRGWVRQAGQSLWLYNEDGSLVGTSAVTTNADGSYIDGYGNRIDPLEPDLTTILTLVEGPALTHRGNWVFWWIGAAVCVFTVLTMLFADEPIRRWMSFRIDNWKAIRFSDWERTSRNISWTVFTVLALLFYLVGLQ